MATLRRGSRGSSVTDLQNRLKAAGFDPGPIDGIYGPRTEAAVRSFQASQNITVDGRAGPQTMAAFGGGGTETPGDSEGETGPRLSLPGSPELWRVGDQDWLIYSVPGAQPPVYMGWRSPSQSDTQSFFGPGQPIKYDRTLSTGGFAQTGTIDFGTTDELANFDDDPFSSWSRTMETESQSQPWIMDQDYQRLVAMAMLEGRALTDAEMQSTTWWRSHTQAEREWMKLYHGDPTEAQRHIDDNRGVARQALVDSGITGFSDELVGFMADQVSQGRWSQQYFSQQVNALSDPASNYQLDSALEPYRAGVGTTIEAEDEVRNLVDRWIGPAYGDWDDAQVKQWAGTLRNDPNGEQRLVEQLKNQRMSLYPEYEDRNLSYDDIAQPWRSFVVNAWGQTPDETEDYFQTVIRQNDAIENGQLLRREGFNRGVGKVFLTANQGLQQVTGGSVRRPV